mmetsp:Transcript_11958/g.17017  ORF Transcript_11958/g.17017 Transcript_11958/m.17017 type:complete len:90 (-) Transcript_11958:455-724(-)
MVPLVAIALMDIDVINVDVTQTMMMRVVYMHPACDMMDVSRKKRMTFKKFWRHGRNTPLIVPNSCLGYLDDNHTRFTSLIGLLELSRAS